MTIEPPAVIPDHMVWDPNRGLVPKIDPAVRTGRNRKQSTRADGKPSQYRQGADRREKFIELLGEGHSIIECCEAVGVKRNTYERWRQRYKEFGARCDVIRADKRDDAAVIYNDDFAAFRKRYLKNPSTWFQLVAVEALQNCKPGEIILLLWPPEHGKTTTLEDFCNYILAREPTTRISVVSEKAAHSKKVLRRVRNRMSPDGPAPEYVMKFGPFVPQPEDLRRGIKQPWADDHFDVWRRGEFDERDYSMSAIGINTGVAGTRADWLLMDDIQSLKSLAQTETIVDTCRQDFFSRPGIHGRICILGTRVGELDVYQKFMDEGLIDHVIVFPAHDSEGKWLWPERYTAEQYTRLRKRVGEQAWFRNYMQRPSAVAQAAFNVEMIEPCFDPHRSVILSWPYQTDQELPVVVTLDPGFGVNAIMALGMEPDRLHYLSSRRDDGFTRTEQIFDALEQTIIRHDEPGRSKVVEVVVEAMAFQKGLVDADAMRAIARRYHVRVVPHMTGSNKYDPDFGIASMALTFQREQITLPYSDAASRAEVDALVNELVAWRAGKRGTRLVQDRVMTMWFGWLRWRQRMRYVLSQQSDFSGPRSPLRRPA